MGDGKLFDGRLPLRNPGYPTFSWSLRPTSALGAVQGIGSPGTNGAVIAQTVGRGLDEYWFIGVLGRGLSKLDAHLQQSIRRTGNDLVASVRMLPSYYRAGGYDSVNARVEVVHPLNGLGNIFSERLEKERRVNGEIVSPRGATVTGSNAVVIPTGTNTFQLYDDGTHGDLHPNNQYWTAILPGLGRYDGMYRFRFILDFTVGGCTTHRELMQSVFVDSKANPATTTSQVISNIVLRDGRRLTTVRILPRDPFQNRWGPGRIGSISCVDPKDCEVGQTVVDHGDGSYSVTLLTPPGVAGVRLNAFNAPVDLPITCPDCPRLTALRLEPSQIQEFQPVTLRVILTGPAPEAGGGGARVYLNSSDPEIASVPENLLIPTGANMGSIVISNAHSHGSNSVTITARYGSEFRQNRLTVVPHTASYVPFEITSIKEAGASLEIRFMSPYRIERHELDMRSSLQPNDQWTHMPAGFGAVGSNNFRVMIPRPAGGQKFFRLRAVFDDHDERATSARAWDETKDKNARMARTLEYRRKPALAIPDNEPGGLRDILKVPDNLDVTDVQIYVDIRHARVGDLVIELRSPQGKHIPLRVRSGSSMPNIVGWYGVELPASSPTLLAQFTGESARGEWTLRISDHGAGDLGQLNEWAVRLTGYERDSLVSQR